MAPQAIHALLASEADGADSEAEFSGDFGVGARGSFEEEKFNETLALRRKRGDGVAQDLLLLGLLHEFFGDGWSFGVGKIGVGVATDEALLLALPAEAMMMRDLHEPLGERFGFAELGEAMEQLDASGLKHFGGFVRWEFVLYGDGVDERFVFIDESRPGGFVAGEALGDESIIGPLGEGVGGVFG
jgi:hypothetical protein